MCPLPHRKQGTLSSLEKVEDRGGFRFIGRGKIFSELRTHKNLAGGARGRGLAAQGGKGILYGRKKDICLGILQRLVLGRLGRFDDLVWLGGGVPCIGGPAGGGGLKKTYGASRRKNAWEFCWLGPGCRAKGVRLRGGGGLFFCADGGG